MTPAERVRRFFQGGNRAESDTKAGRKRKEKGVLKKKFSLKVICPQCRRVNTRTRFKHNCVECGHGLDIKI